MACTCYPEILAVGNLCAACEARTLRAELAKVTAERDALLDAADERDAEWQEATGIICGGDPGGVTPEGLRRFTQREADANRCAVQSAFYEGRRSVMAPLKDASPSRNAAWDASHAKRALDGAGEGS